jgi:uncharacterized protein YbaR (Trm112 family)
MRLNLKLAQKNKEANSKAWDKLQEALISEKIRKVYSINDELAILRQRDEKPEEFEAYYKFVEECKREIKAKIGEAE